MSIATPTPVPKVTKLCHKLRARVASWHQIQKMCALMCTMKHVSNPYSKGAALQLASGAVKFVLQCECILIIFMSAKINFVPNKKGMGVQHSHPTSTAYDL